MIENVLTKKERDKFTPEEVITELKNGNKRFKEGNLTERDTKAMVKDSFSGQSPKAIILSCVDSRVPVEEVFDQGIGDLFVARVAGNIVNEDMLGSMEYACGVVGSKAIVVMGHQSCGAVKSAIDDVQTGNITALLAKIRPAIDLVPEEEFSGDDRVSSNLQFKHAVCKSNVVNTIQNIRAQSSMLNDLELETDEDKRIKIVGAIYNIKEKDREVKGSVEFFEVPRD